MAALVAAWPKLPEAIRTTHTFVEPVEYRDLLLNLRTPGRGLVIEGPSGIGKTTAVEYSGPPKVNHSGQLHLLRLFPSQPP